MKKLYAAIILFAEVARYLLSEFRSGHTGTFGHTFERYVANQIHGNRYRGARRSLMLHFAFRTALSRRDGKMLAGLLEDFFSEIVGFRVHPSDRGYISEIVKKGGSVLPDGAFPSLISERKD